MGQEIEADAAISRKRRIEVQYTGHDTKKARIVLVRNGEEFDERTIQGPEVLNEVNHLTFEDAEPLDKAAVRGARYHKEPFVVYYVRVEDGNGAHQWSSPIWIDLT